jgi:hypothetical protein
LAQGEHNLNIGKLGLSQGSYLGVLRYDNA